MTPGTTLADPAAPRAARPWNVMMRGMRRPAVGALGVSALASGFAWLALPDGTAWWVAPLMMCCGLGMGVMVTLVLLYAHQVRARQQPRPLAPCATADGLAQLDQHMLAQLQRAIQLSETSAMNMIERVTGLRGLSARLMDYLRIAQRQSTTMQAEIEHNGAIIHDLAEFVRRLPSQIAEERQLTAQMMTEVQRLSGITDTIRGMARQTEILSINAAVAAAHAGEAGRGFAVLAGEVRRLAMQSNEAAQEIQQHIDQLVQAVSLREHGEAADRLRKNENEALRLVKQTSKLNDGYLDIRQFYALLLTAVTEHNAALDDGITQLLDTAQYQDVFKQIVDRLHLAFASKHELTAEIVARLRTMEPRLDDLDTRAQRLSDDYLATEALHRDPEASAQDAPGAPGVRIELF